MRRGVRYSKYLKIPIPGQPSTAPLLTAHLLFIVDLTYLHIQLYMYNVDTQE
eukprot:SAG25_NODE_19_length_23408_cov_10.997040_21_plen_52_part_00